MNPRKVPLGLEGAVWTWRYNLNSSHVYCMVMEFDIADRNGRD